MSVSDEETHSKIGQKVIRLLILKRRIKQIAIVPERCHSQRPVNVI